MERSDGGGEISAKRSKISSDSTAGEDRLSALPDDVLVIILLHLLTREAARTSALSRRWRRVWTLLPELRFFFAQDSHRIRSALEPHEASLRYLVVETRDAAPDSVAAWLPAAARRICGHFVFRNLVREDGEQETTERGTFALPCLERATAASLHLGLIGLAVPPAGVFARLTELSLTDVWIHGPGELGDAVSSPRCPCLQKLTVRYARGLGNLVIHSNSLRQVESADLGDLEHLTIVVSALKDLEVTHCFWHSWEQPTASILAPQLVTLVWNDTYDPSYVHLGEMEQLQSLRPFFFLVYGEDSLPHNHACLNLLRRFKTIQSLVLVLHYFWLDAQQIDDYPYLMEDMTMLPDITFLKLVVSAEGHAFGASTFHVLRMCSGIRRLMLSLVAPTDVEAQTTCPSGCICSDTNNWETEQLLLNHLQEVEISQLRRSEHDVTFVKQLFKWVTVLEKMTITFDCSVTESMVKEMCQVLRSFSRPQIRMEFYMYQDMIKEHDNSEQTLFGNKTNAGYVGAATAITPQKIIGLQNQPVASTSTTQLVSLDWRDLYDPGSVDLGKMECVQWLETFFFLVYGQDGLAHNHACLRLLERFKAVEGLTLTLAYMWEIENLEYMMDGMTVLPDLKFTWLYWQMCMPLGAAHSMFLGCVLV